MSEYIIPDHVSDATAISKKYGIEPEGDEAFWRRFLGRPFRDLVSVLSSYSGTFVADVQNGVVTSIRAGNVHVTHPTT